MSTAGTDVPDASSTPSADKLLAEKWAGEVDILGFERPVLAKRIKQLGPTGKKIHVPKIGSFSRTIIAETLSGYTTGLTFTGNQETEFTATPRTSVIPIEITKSIGWRALAMNPKDDLRRAADGNLLAAIDSDPLSLPAALTTLVGDAALDL